MLFAVTNYSIQTIQNSIDVSVYFKIGLAESQIQNIQQQLEQNNEVKSVTYVSAQQAYDNFKADNADKPVIVESLNELPSNPFPATLHTKVDALSDYPAIAAELQEPQFKDFISTVNYQNDPKIQLAIDRLDKILKFIVTFGVGLVVVFCLIAILVIFNTITLTIYNRKEEVEIMRLVGATNAYIRGPFITEAFLYSIFATIISGLLFIPIFTKVLPKAAAWVNPQVNVLNQNIFSFWYLALMMFIVSFVLAEVPTYMAIRKYLKV